MTTKDNFIRKQMSSLSGLKVGKRRSPFRPCCYSRSILLCRKDNGIMTYSLHIKIMHFSLSSAVDNANSEILAALGEW